MKHHESWNDFFNSQAKLLAEIEAKLAGLETNPARDLWFRAFAIDVSKIRVLMVGQDPYPNPRFATGLAFSVPAGINPLPSSLRNIFKELAADVGTPTRMNGDLSDWESQGVWLLNRVLTTSPNTSLSHSKLGWEQFTTAAIEYVNKFPAPRVAVLWGGKAQELRPRLVNWEILTSPHPSPLSANRGFFGSQPFSKVNEYLSQANQPLIQWG